MTARREIEPVHDAHTPRFALAERQYGRPSFNLRTSDAAISLRPRRIGLSQPSFMNSRTFATDVPNTFAACVGVSAQGSPSADVA